MGGRPACGEPDVGGAIVTRSRCRESRSAVVLSPARRCALTALVEAQRRGAYVRDVLAASPDAAALEGRDRAFALRLALGATAVMGCADELLDRFLARPDRVQPALRWALRIAAFELLYLDTPAHVGVSQGVELARSVARGAAGLANAVLRRVAEARASYLDARDVLDDRRPGVARARRAGMPVWLADDIAASRGEAAAAAVLAAQLQAAPQAVQVAAPAPGSFRPAWADAGETASYPGCVRVGDAALLMAEGVLERAEAASSDLNAQLIAGAATRPGTCLEVGAGRGTKTFVMAAQARRVGWARTHVALDLSAAKCALNAERMSAAGLGRLETVAGDATDLDAVLAPRDARLGAPCRFATVFVDAPCSGTGTMRRHPEIAWRLSAAEVHEDLPCLQLAILRQAARRVEEGGELVYATCSVLRAENEQVVEAFLASAEGAAFVPVPVSAAPLYDGEAYAEARSYLRAHEDAQGMFQTVPAPGAFDGHFCARLVRR